jgi:hypothetical protein
VAVEVNRDVGVDVEALALEIAQRVRRDVKHYAANAH